MIDVIVMPKLGFNMDEGKLVTWYKAEGEAIGKGEPLFAIETDKTNIDVEATRDGIVRKLLVSEGDSIPVTLPIAIIADGADDVGAEVEKACALLGREPGAAAPSAKEAPAQAAPPAPAADRDFDAVVIGGGPGGYVAAIRLAQLGKRAALIEKDSVGGVCLNRGCIPTKALLRSVEALNEVRECENFGVLCASAGSASLDMKKVQARKAGVVKQLVGGVEALLKGNGVTLIRGEGALKDAHTVEAGGRAYSAESIVIATGSSIKSLPIPIDGSVDMLTSDDVLALDSVPKEAVIIGGGVIGVEFAYFLACAGAKVTVVEFLERVLPMVDEEITALAAARLAELGVEIHTGARVTGIADGAVNFQKDGKEHSVKAGSVIMAVGRAPDLGGIDCESLGIRTEGGAIATDSALRTSLPNVYAIGDVNGKAMLAHTATMEGICAADSICGHGGEMRYDSIPTAIYIQPEIASVGLTEAQARERYGDRIKIGKFPLLANGKAKVAGQEKGLAKVIAESEYGEIVGVHLYCLHATDMIAEAVAAMNLEATAEEIAGSVHPHPTVSEAIQEAFHAVSGKAIHWI
ncbi:MAG: dihydrolipoyl dehydrogenase [Clostridiales Family XIII bacterium]|jgi:dihydrolipoamide dehydrogenase|nr:dihydrolipoyl dehydrogenase [Clostridiales Family XIII bacterium]